MTLFTVNRATNAEMMKRILAFYKPPPAKILDSTYGYGSFWKGFQSHTFDGDYELTTMDIRPLPGVSQVSDYTKPLPFPDSSFDVIVYDPPYGAPHLEITPAHDSTKVLLCKDEFAIEGDGLLEMATAKEFYMKLKRDGILVYKRTHIPDEMPPIFNLFDYIIQDTGFKMLSGNGITAKTTHAMWMILRKVLK